MYLTVNIYKSLGSIESKDLLFEDLLRLQLERTFNIFSNKYKMA